MEPKNITARTALITGGTGGLGLAMARGLLADGHRVALVDNNPAAIERSEEVLRDIGGDLLAVVGDVSVEAACRSAVQTVGESFGPVRRCHRTALRRRAVG